MLDVCRSSGLSGSVGTPVALDGRSSVYMRRQVGADEIEAAGGRVKRWQVVADETVAGGGQMRLWLVVDV